MEHSVKKIKLSKKNALQRITFVPKFEKKFKHLVRKPPADRVPAIQLPCLTPPTSTEEVHQLQAQLETPLQSKFIRKYAKCLSHADQCSGCNEPLCRVMKRALNHERSCLFKKEGGCGTCLNMRKIKYFHMRRCRNESCLMPRCIIYKIKRHVDAVVLSKAESELRSQKFTTPIDLDDTTESEV